MPIHSLSPRALTILLSLVFITLQTEGIALKTRLNTDQHYRSVNVKGNELYFIDVSRIESSQESQNSRCKSISKYIDITSETEVFRLSKSESLNRQEKVYEKLTSLNEQENIIEEFEIINNTIFIITTQGDGYFVSLQNYNQIQKVQTNFFENKSGQFSDIIVIKNYKERVLIIGRNKIVMCKMENKVCDVVEGYEKMQNFRGAQLYEENGRYFIFIIQTHSIVFYELTANGKVKNKQILDSSFFGVEKISIRALYRTDKNKLLVLDDLQGIRQITTENGFQSFKNGSRLVYEQYGCYQFVGQDNGESLALACAPSINNYFILKIVKSRQFAEAIYEPLETVFLHQKLYQIDYIENLLLSRVFSGVKLYWSSKQLGNPYPHFYRNAGDLFLHNAIQAKLKMLNNVKTIFLAAEDELLLFELDTIQPYVTCSSNKQVMEQYKLTYYFPCNQQAFMHQQNICTSEQSLTFEAWQHKELKVMSHIVPFLFSLIGVVAIIYLVIKVYKRYGDDVERAKLKYNIQQNQIQS